MFVEVAGSAVRRNDRRPTWGVGARRGCASGDASSGVVARRRGFGTGRLWLCLGLLLLTGCRVVGEMPSNHRIWSPDMAVLPQAEVNGPIVHVHNVRHCKYATAETYVLAHEDRTYDLDRLRTVDFIMVPFRETPSVAHTMLSFGFEGNEYVAVSVEIRRQDGEDYNMLKGLTDQYELMYVIGDERDLIKLRTNYRGDDVYLYRSRATPEQARRLFVDVMRRVNELAEKPEFYNLVTNNCTTNIRRHINQLHPGQVPYSMAVLLPGYSDRLAYDLGLLDTRLPYAEARRRANVTDLARKYADSPDFSVQIRR